MIYTHKHTYSRSRSPNFNANDQIRVKGIECLCVQHTLISEYSVWFWRAKRGRGRERDRKKERKKEGKEVV